MKQPLDFIPEQSRKPIFFLFLAAAMLLLLVFQLMDVPLRNDAAPAGIVSFELAGTVQRAGRILAAWGTVSQQGAFPVFQPLIIQVAFGLGLDYLFMAAYAIALSAAVLLAAGRQAGWLRRIGGWMGWAPVAAACFDALENYALLQLLLGKITGTWAWLAAMCASIKFALLGLSILYGLVCWFLSRRS